jgi:hypothetical protein
MLRQRLPRVLRRWCQVLQLELQHAVLEFWHMQLQELWTHTAGRSPCREVEDPHCRRGTYVSFFAVGRMVLQCDGRWYTKAAAPSTATATRDDMGP